MNLSTLSFKISEVKELRLQTGLVRPLELYLIDCGPYRRAAGRDTLFTRVLSLTSSTLVVRT